MDFIRHFVNKKCKELKKDELIELASKWNIQLPEKEQERLFHLLHSDRFDFFEEGSRLQLQSILMNILGSRFKW